MHPPEVCFTAAGMELRQIYGKKQYIANGVPLVFKVYEFVDRNMPVFVFSCTWEKNVGQSLMEEGRTASDISTLGGMRMAIQKYAQGDRGITDEVRVLKLGVWGPRTIGEAEAAFQQQLNFLIRPKA